MGRYVFREYEVNFPFFRGIQTLMYGIVWWISAAICGIFRVGVFSYMTHEWTIVPLQKWRVGNEKKTSLTCLAWGVEGPTRESVTRENFRQLDATSPRNHNQVKVSTKRWGLQNGWWSGGTLTLDLKDDFFSMKLWWFFPVCFWPNVNCECQI